MTKTAHKTRKHRANDEHRHSHIGECCDTTFHGIQHWYKHLFEKLGWMILAKDNGMTDKTSHYLHSLKRIKTALEQKMKSTRDHDKKEDLHIMYDNICVLMKHAEQDL